jgi:hypothetical protein
MKQIRFKAVACLLVLAVAAAVSCTHVVNEDNNIILVATSEAFKRFSGEFENTAYFARHKPGSVAVLPFEALDGKSYSFNVPPAQSAQVVRRGMYNHISSLPFRDLEIYETDRRLNNAGLRSVPDMDAMIAEDPEKMRSLLGVDAVVTGKVTHFDRIYVGIYSQIAVGCEVKMWDLRSGNLLWRAKHVTRAHAGGLSISPIGLAMATIASVWNLRETEMLSQTDDLFREIVSTMDLPESMLVGRSAAPRIDLFTATNPGKPFTVGKRVAFRIVGDPGCKAYFDLGDFKSGIEMVPVSAEIKQALTDEVVAAIETQYRETGHDVTPELLEGVRKEMASREIYEGRYTVAPDEEVYGLLAKGYLVDDAGSQATAIDAAHTIDVDSLPPAAPVQVVAGPLDQRVQVGWAANEENDLTGYEIWSSATPLSGFAQTAASEKNGIVMAGLTNFEPVYVKIRALDRAGNAGDFSRPVRGVALPEPDLYDLPQPGPGLGGEIAGKVLLVADKGPFTVQSSLRVGAGAALYLEPGVEIRFAPETVLSVVGGDLMAYGNEKKPIRLVPAAAGDDAGAWQGVVLDGAGRSVLRHVVIDRAATGLTIGHSAPDIFAARITGSADAGLYLRDNARPNISCSTFSGNGGQGAMVIEGEGVHPIIRDNAFEQNEPFQVQSYTPLKVDLSGNFWGRPDPDSEWFMGDIQWQPVLTQRPGPCPQE